MHAPVLSKVFGVNSLWLSTRSPSHHIVRDVWKNAQAASKSLLQHCVSSGKHQCSGWRGGGRLGQCFGVHDVTSEQTGLINSHFNLMDCILRSSQHSQCSFTMKLTIIYNKLFIYHQCFFLPKSWKIWYYNLLKSLINQEEEKRWGEKRERELQKN